MGWTRIPRALCFRINSLCRKDRACKFDTKPYTLLRNACIPKLGLYRQLIPWKRFCFCSGLCISTRVGVTGGWLGKERPTLSQARRDHPRVWCPRTHTITQPKPRGVPIFWFSNGFSCSSLGGSPHEDATIHQCPGNNPSRKARSSVLGNSFRRSGEIWRLPSGPPVARADKPVHERR